MEGYIFTSIAEDWDSKTDEQKEEIFKMASFVRPDANDLSTIGSPFQVAMYSDIDIEFGGSVDITGILSPKLVLPKSLFGLDFENINSMTADVVVSGGGNVRFIFTKDMRSYYTLSEGEFVQVSSMDAQTVAEEGVTPEILETIDRSTWGKFFKFNDEIGIGFVLAVESTTDEASVDSILLNVDMRGYYKKAEHMTDYDYRYTSSRNLKVTLLTDGTYKINYVESDEGGGGGYSKIDEWKPNTDYTAGTFFVHENTIYEVNEDFTSGEEFDDTYCTALTGETATSAQIRELFV